MFKEYVSENNVHIYLCTHVAFSKLEFLNLMIADSWGQIILCRGAILWNVQCLPAPLPLLMRCP